MKYSIDRIENNIAIIENITTGEKKEIDLNLLPDNIKEGTIIIEDNNIFSLDIDTEKERKQSIINKFNSLRKK